MKNLKRTGLAIALAFTFLSSQLVAFPTTEPTDNKLISVTETGGAKYEINHVKNSQKVVMGLKLENLEKIRLTVLNDENEEVFSKWYRPSNGFMQTFDFKGMNDGAYTFKIKAGEDEMENVVIMRDDYSILPSFSAYISEIEDEKVKFSYFAPSENVSLILKDSQGENLYEKKVGAGFNSSGIANLSKLDKGTYVLQIKNGSNVESKEIEIK